MTASHRLVGEHVVEVGGRLRVGEHAPGLGEHLVVEVAAPGELGAGQAVDVAGQVGAPVVEADDADADGLSGHVVTFLMVERTRRRAFGPPPQSFQTLPSPRPGGGVAQVDDELRLLDDLGVVDRRSAPSR